MNFKIIKYKVLFILCYVIIVPNTFAQNYIDLFELESFYSNRVLENSDDQIKLNSYNINAIVPLFNGNTSSIALSLNYDNLETENESDKYFKVFSFATNLVFSKSHNEFLTVRYILMPKLLGNPSKTNTKVTQLGFAALANKLLNETANISYGFLYNNQLFGPFIVPLIGYYTKVNDIEVNILLPQNMDVNYKVNPNIFIGLKFNGKMNSYALESNAFGLNQNTYLSANENQLGTYLDYNYKNFHFSIFGGYSFMSSYKIYSDLDRTNLSLFMLKFGDNRYQLNDDLKNGFVIKSSVYYRFYNN
ncbi:hypothetical protein OBA44_03170 [Bacteroidota bacterium]|nr:hypothetical protein [Bacteroidota bacterium]